MSYRDEAFAFMHGCGSHNCKIRPPQGMGNNGRCRCFDRLSDVQANQIILTLAKADNDSQFSYRDGYHAGHDAAWAALKKSSKKLAANLQRFNDWRRGKDDKTMDEAGLSHAEIGQWIDMAIHRLGGKP